MLPFLLVKHDNLLKFRGFSYNRDAINDLALHFLTKMKIMVLRDIERAEVEFICKVWLHCFDLCRVTIGCWNNRNFPGT